MSPRVECLPRKHEALSLIPPALPDSEHDGACLNYSEFEGGLSEIPISKKKETGIWCEVEAALFCWVFNWAPPKSGWKSEKSCLFRRDHLQSQHPHVCLWSPVFLVTLVLKQSWRRTLQCFLPDWISKLSRGCWGLTWDCQGFTC